MRKKGLIVVLALISILLMGCYRTREELFTVSIENSAFEYSGEEPIRFLGKEITTFRVRFEATGDTTDQTKDYELNLFGDFSQTPIALFQITIQIGIEGEEEQTLETTFMGIANPQRENAYRVNVKISGLTPQEESFHVIFDFDSTANVDQLESIQIQIKDHINPVSSAEDAVFDIVRIEETL